ncbi:hypothetical protein TNCV_749951 [Trichonephila clavipes]|nr:hypothetical protein TNCV_749951 [Trichonephila clavipes]
MSNFIYLSNIRAWLLDHLTPSLPVPTDDVINRVFIESSALEQVVAILSGISTEWESLVSSHAKPVKAITPLWVCVVGDRHSRIPTQPSLVTSAVVVRTQLGTGLVTKDYTSHAVSFGWRPATLQFDFMVYRSES